MNKLRMQAYGSLFIARFSLLLQYRAAAFAGIMTQIFWGAVKVSESALSPPASGFALIAFIFTLIGAVLLSTALTMLLTVSLMWTLSGEGINTIAPSFVIIFSGMIVPLPLFPDWIQPLLNGLPFAGLLDRPFRLFTGHLAPDAVFAVLLHQAVWIGILVLFGRFLVQRGIQKLIIQGG